LKRLLLPPITIAATAVAAFAVADIAHEALGHGGGCVAAGGKIVSVSTTFEECTIRSRIVDGAGPAGGILVAMLVWLWARFLPPRSPATHMFLCFVFAFAAFWNFGYLIKSGLTNQGDWAFVIADWQPPFFWRAAITVTGVVLYALSVRALAALLKRDLDASQGEMPIMICLTAYIAAIVTACLAASLDPRGPSTILSDALPSSLGALGLPLAGWALQRRIPDARLAIAPSRAWIAGGAIAGAAFVSILGPGLPFQ
jgi:hypothetical protein